MNYTKRGRRASFRFLNQRDWRIYQTAGCYFQDAWRFHPDLTITLGVRYQYQSAPNEVHGTEAQFFNTSEDAMIVDSSDCK